MTVPSTSPATVLTGTVFGPDRVISDGVIVLQGDRIDWVGPRADLPAERGLQAPAGTDILIPGLVDLHNHGARGGEFGGSGPQAGQLLQAAIDHHRGAGTTSMLGSFVSASDQDTRAGIGAAAALVATGELDGIHLEGPFLSVARCGAQNPAVLRDPDPAELAGWVRAAAEAGAPGAIRQLTWAPERPGGLDFVAALAESGIVPALGHTDADGTTATRALAAARASLPDSVSPLVTHLFNGMPPMHHRAPGPVAPAIRAAAAGEAVVEVIADGVHLDPMVVTMLFETIGPDGIALITDALPPTGQPDGRYRLGGQEILIEGGRAHLARSGAIAGSTATLLDLVRFAIEHCGVDPADAVRAASATPARAIGLADRGELRSGQRADLVVLDRAWHPIEVYRAGRPVSRPTS